MSIKQGLILMLILNIFMFVLGLLTKNKIVIISTLFGIWCAFIGTQYVEDN